MSLLEALARVPDPRDPRGKAYPLPSILALMVLGMLMGRRSLSSISSLVADYGGNLALALGFRHAKVPSVSRLSTLLRLLDAEALERALTEWIAGRVDAAGQPIALDGKTLRGSTPDKGTLPGQHLVAAYAPHAAAVLGQLRVDAKTNEHKAALTLLGMLPDLRGAVVTGDAMFCQKEVAAAIRRRGGDYVLAVKDNQKRLRTDIDAALGFDQATATFSP